MMPLSLRLQRYLELRSEVERREAEIVQLKGRHTIYPTESRLALAQLAAATTARNNLANEIALHVATQLAPSVDEKGPQ